MCIAYLFGAEISDTGSGILLLKLIYLQKMCNLIFKKDYYQVTSMQGPLIQALVWVLNVSKNISNKKSIFVGKIYSKVFHTKLFHEAYSSYISSKARRFTEIELIKKGI